MRTKLHLGPSANLYRAVSRCGGVNPAAKAWQIEYTSLARFMSGKGGINTDTMLAISKGSGLSYQEAFVKTQ